MSDSELGSGTLLIGREHDLQGSLPIGQQRRRYAASMFPRRTRRLGIRKRISRFVRALFGGSESSGEWTDAEGGVGVREPRRPRTPSFSGAVALEAPTHEPSEIWAVGEDRD